MRIKYVNNQPHCFDFGGFDYQMLRVYDLCAKDGCSVSKLDLWQRNIDFDGVHIWGYEHNRLELINSSKKHGLKVYISALLPYRSLRSDIAAVKRYLFQNERAKRKASKVVDKLLVVNDEQAESAKFYYGFKNEQIAVIPTILDDGFFNCSSPQGRGDFFLMVGNICERKQQLEVARIMVELNERAVFIGNLLNPTSDYTYEFMNLIKKNKKLEWIQSVQVEELIKCYMDCSAIIVFGKIECQPAAGLEAVALNRPLIMLGEPYSNQRYFKNATIIKSNFSSIIQLKDLIMSRKFKINSYTNDIEECRAQNAISKYINLYEK
jgi:glycosyltransferase involved in cell wall biosynthesis